MGLKIGIASIALAAALFGQGAWAVDAAKPADATLIAQGSKHWEEDRLEDARKSFEKAVAANPGSKDAHMKLAGLQLSSRNYAAAIQAYQRTISLDGKNAKAWIGLGMAYLHDGQSELSRAAFEEAVRVDPSRKTQLAQLMTKPARQEAPAPVGK